MNWQIVLLRVPPFKTEEKICEVELNTTFGMMKVFFSLFRSKLK
jgi:hypothetical protein